MADGGQLDGFGWIGPILDRYEGPLVRYAWRITGDLDRARDVVQDTFIRLCAEDRSALDGRIAAWLFAVCRHRALDVVRKERRMETLSESRMAAETSREPGPAATVEGRQTASAVLAMLAELPANQQEVIRLKFQDALSYKEIARVTGLSVSNVGYLIHVGIKTLRQRLAGAPGDGAGRLS